MHSNEVWYLFVAIKDYYVYMQIYYVDYQNGSSLQVVELSRLWACGIIISFSFLQVPPFKLELCRMASAGFKISNSSLNVSLI